MGHLSSFLSLVLVFSCLARLLAANEATELGEGLRKDAAALQAFRKDIESDPSGALEDWGKGPNPCGWFGVDCDQVSSAGWTFGAPGSQDVDYRVVGLELWGLELAGIISPEIGKLSELRTLILVGNRFSGQIPSEIRNCHKLSTLDLRSNLLSGTISFTFADLPRLESLRLSENALSGKLGVLFSGRRRTSYFHFLGGRKSSEQQPPSSYCSSLTVLDLDKNKFVGPIPSTVGRCTQLSEVNLSGNRLVGSIPLTLSTMPSLHTLFLSNNHLDGPFPASLAACKNLHHLDVSNNLLGGAIPSTVGNLDSSQHFKFANNQLEGKMPAGGWRLQQMVMEGSFAGNPDLCGWPLSQLCNIRSTHTHGDSSSWLHTLSAKLYKPVQMWVGRFSTLSVKGSIGSVHQVLESRRRSLADSTPSSHTHGHKARRWAVGLALGLVAGALAALLVATILRLFVFYLQKGPYLHGPIIFHPNISPRMLLFLEKDDALSQEDLIGEGAAGKVYEVQLENDKVVAVKTVRVRDDQRSILGQKQIQSELETLGCIRHRNLVSLLAYVHTPTCHLLLYEYMKYGSLSHALQQVKAGTLELPWPIRHKIAIGTAQGLSYLHFQSKPKIVHRDLKPSNILLDENFKAHIADFGLAKIIPTTDTHVSTGVAGTVGYIAPEYNEACRFTEMCDVYSFGVVLAVLLTGKEPKDPFFQTVPGGNIASWLHDLTQSPDVKDAIDPHLRTGNTEDEEQIILALKVAAFCTLGNPAKRPTSKEALVMLTQIRDDADAHV